MLEVTVQRTNSSGVLIRGDIEPFKSVVDGSVISGRAALREHDKRHNVTNPADFKNEWAAKRKERDRAYTPGSGYDRERRIEHIKRALEKKS
jgi:DUF917 family protein